MIGLRIVSGLLIAIGAAAAAHAEDPPRDEVEFQVTQTTVFGQSVFVLGDLPELGAGDIRHAVKLEPSSYPNWTAPISLPANRDYAFQFYIRDDAPADFRDAANGTPIGSPQSASTSEAPLEPAAKTIYLYSAIDPPTLHWRQGNGAFAQAMPTTIGPGRTGGEQLWAIGSLGEAGRPVEFYFTNDTQTIRIPGSGNFNTRLDTMLVQDANVFGYEPAPAVSPARKDYNPANPPGINSTNLGGEFRRYRVFLPRGYDEHLNRSYPVLYMHDGQNVFDQGPFGTWDADITAERMTRLGEMREIIIVGIDNTANRFVNYVTPDDGGQADDYVSFIVNELKPVIDGQYRTLPSADNTGAMGSSLGGVVSMYMGWDFPGTFARIGAMSGSWQLQNFPNRVKSQPKRDIRLYMDSGDSGPSSDNFWGTMGLRDNLIAKSPAHYVIEDDLRHCIGFNQQHNEAAWAARLPEAYAFLFPITEDDNTLVPITCPGDLNADSAVDIGDLNLVLGNFGNSGAPGLPGDANSDGSVDINDLNLVLGNFGTACS